MTSRRERPTASTTRRFEDYLTEFDGVPTQLAGKRLEMSATAPGLGRRSARAGPWRARGH